uniref:Uncharacterized protein n=1 Tax=Parascaris equorum TaxID=6256 RepID=A0A914SK57_PAREQ
MQHKLECLEGVDDISHRSEVLESMGARRKEKSKTEQPSLCWIRHHQERMKLILSMSEGDKAILQQTRWVNEATALSLKGLKPIEKEANCHMRASLVSHIVIYLCKWFANRESMGKDDAFLGISMFFADFGESGVVKFI